MRVQIFVGIVALVAVGMSGCNKDSGSGGPDATACTPTTCVAQGKNCGTIIDNCGGELICGQCTGTDFCGGTGTANVCGNGLCQPTNCVAENAACGQLSDDCSDVLDCGACISPAVCGGGGVANQCAVPVVPDAGVPGPDSGTTGQCDSTCMAQSGAVCCETCGCDGATVRCDPVCESPFEWDCEVGCCFNYTTFQCQ